ncbi:MAG TPA: ATP-binding protein [Candidatus Saccharimonadales bacterium]
MGDFSQSMFTGSPFWYRRVAEISLLIDAVILALFGVTFLGGGANDPAMQISAVAAGAAGLNAIIAAVAIFYRNDEHLNIWAIIAFGLLVATTALLILTTGGIASPYVALWILVATFAGLFGLPGLLVLGLLANGYIAWQFMAPQPGLTNDRLLMFALASDLPLVVSYIIWHSKSQHEAKKSEKVSQLTKELSEVSNKAEIVINAIADGVLALDSKGTIQLINPAAQNLLGWGKNEAINLDYALVMKLTSKQDQPINNGQNPIEQVRVIKQTVVNNELTLTSKTGKKMVTSLVVSPMLDEAHNIAGSIVVFRDITAETKAQREQAEFVSTASHEMRTPVAAIEGYLGLALNPQTAQIDQKARLYLQKAQEAVQHLGRLFQDLLTVTRADDNRLKQHPKTTNIVAYVESIAESLEPKAKEKGLKLLFAAHGKDTVDGQKKLSPVYYASVDRDHLREVVANLIENAIKYTKQGEIIADVTGDDKHVIISVKDNGIGIPKEDIPHLFQKFYRVDSSDTREIGGTGLGLYICRKLVESMRGSITLESALGKGSTFYVALPRLSGAQVRQLQDSEAIEALQERASGATTASAPAPMPPQPAPTAVKLQHIDFAPLAGSAQPTPITAALQPQTSLAAPASPQQPRPQTTAPRREPTITELQAQWHAAHSQPAREPATPRPIAHTPQAQPRGAISIPTRQTAPVITNKA